MEKLSVTSKIKFSSISRIFAKLYFIIYSNVSDITSILNMNNIADLFKTTTFCFKHNKELNKYKTNKFNKRFMYIRLLLRNAYFRGKHEPGHV